MFITVKKFNELAAECEALKAKVTEQEALTAAATATAAATQVKLDAETARANDLATKLADKTSAHDKLADASAKLATEFDAKVSARALEITQKQGVPPVAANPAKDPVTGTATSKRDEFLAITDTAARAAFWAAHREEILSGK